MCARIRVPFGFAPGGGTFLTPRSIRRKHLMQRARGASRPGDAGSARLSHAPREQCKKSLIGACGRHAPPRTWTPALRNRQRGPILSLLPKTSQLVGRRVICRPDIDSENRTCLRSSPSQINIRARATTPHRRPLHAKKMVASDHIGVSFGYFGAMAWCVLLRDPDPKPDR